MNRKKRISDKNLNKIIIGGTFDILHKGHHTLFKKAFSLGEVTIGLTSDKMAKILKKRKVQNFKERKKELEKFIEKNFSKKYKITKIEDKFGPTLQEDFDFIVVSPETVKTALLIDKKRQKQGKKPIKTVEIKFVLAKDGKPISSTRILKGEINEKGELIK